MWLFNRLRIKYPCHSSQIRHYVQVMETKSSGLGKKPGISAEKRTQMKAKSEPRPIYTRRRRRATTYTRSNTAVVVTGAHEQRAPKRNTPERPNLRRRKASCPEILLSRTDLTSKNLPELVKLVKIGEADLGTLALLGIYPLHDAVAKGMVEFVRMLIDKAASVNVLSKEGHTPLDIAVQTGNFECAELLITHGASTVDIQDGFRWKRDCQ